MSSLMSIVHSVVGRPSTSFGPGSGGCVPPTPRCGTPAPGPTPLPLPGGDRDAQVQGSQLQSIADGVRNGSITAQEAEKLLAQQKQLADATAAAKADGHVSFFERMQLNAMERKAGNAIGQAKNNAEQDFFAEFDPTAQKQADQIDRIASGRQNGNVTHKEASKLLGQQTQIADARGNMDSMFDVARVDHQQNQASGSINHLGRRGDQLSPFKPLPGGDRDARVQGKQLHDIAEGVRNGSITSNEAEKLLAQQKELADATAAAKADGKVTLGERLRLAAMEAKAGKAIDQAKNNFQRDPFARFDSSAQKQASQIDRIANGRTNGNVTHTEASKLLGQQERIADHRNDGNFIGSFMANMEQSQADGDIRHHSRPGTQRDFNILPFFRANIAG